MDEVKHTPLPWRAPGKAGYVYGPDVVVARCGNPGDGEIAPFNIDRWNADAALIVEAVNNHAPLRALVTELVGALGKLNALVDFTTGDENLQYLQLALEIDDPAHLRETLDDMAIALAAARAQGFEP